MNKSIIPLTACLLSIFSCEVSTIEDPTFDGSAEQNEVRTLLQGNLHMPAGKLQSKDQFQADENGLHFRSYSYYDQNGNLILSIGIYKGGDRGAIFGFTEEDTTGASTFHYERGKLSEMKSFKYKNGSFSFDHSILYSYDENGRLFQILNSNQEPKVTHYYNGLGQLQYKKYGKNQDMEMDEFRYDDQGRMLLHIYWGGETPIFEHYFVYNDQGKLKAKETWSGPDNKEDVFRFFYNDEGQLIEELEFYPQYGFEQRFKRIYTYYPENTVSRN